MSPTGATEQFTHRLFSAAVAAPFNEAALAPTYSIVSYG